ncbi:MAG: hypothetical protein Q7U53_17290 [Anaerolineaceae bacterium]|nr:hypothetical protein [Anaerolineaceae bacterium]
MALAIRRSAVALVRCLCGWRKGGANGVFPGLYDWKTRFALLGGITATVVKSSEMVALGKG